jgi:membrane protease YdiL (CAAX protease family)
MAPAQHSGGAVNMRRDTITAIWTGAFAVLMTALVSGVWGGLLLANLVTSPAVPWAAVVMALVLWALWSYLGGRWSPAGTGAARRALLRGDAPSGAVGLWAIMAGALWVAALAGFWEVLHRLVAAPGNPMTDFSRLPPLTVAVSLGMAAVSGAVSEEAGFRGYFQGALERRGLGAFAVLVAALLMAPHSRPDAGLRLAHTTVLSAGRWHAGRAGLCHTVDPTGDRRPRGRAIRLLRRRLAAGCAPRADLGAWARRLVLDQPRADGGVRGAGRPRVHPRGQPSAAGVATGLTAHTYDGRTFRPPLAI